MIYFSRFDGSIVKIYNDPQVIIDSKDFRSCKVLSTNVVLTLFKIPSTPNSLKLVAHDYSSELPIRVTNVQNLINFDPKTEYWLGTGTNGIMVAYLDESDPSGVPKI